MAATDWVAVGLSAGALALSSWAFVYSRRATVAAEASATAAIRATAVAERQEQRDLRDSEERAVRWQLASLAAGVNALTNIGEGTAHDVRVEVPEGIKVWGPPERQERIPPGGMMRVGAAVDADTVDDRVHVYWRNQPGGDERHWNHPAAQ